MKKRVDVESNAGKLRKRNEVVVEEVYLKIAEEVRVRTRHENLKRASGSEVKGEGRYEVTRVEDMREEQGVRKYLVKWKGHRERTCDER